MPDKLIAGEEFQALQSQRNQLYECLEDMVSRFKVCAYAYKIPHNIADKMAIDKAEKVIEEAFKSKAIGK